MHDSKNAALAAFFFLGAPGMAQMQAVKVRCGLTQTGPLAASKGAHREVGSEGSLRQIGAVTNRN